MSGPWEDYQQDSGPWSDYQSQPVQEQPQPKPGIFKKAWNALAVPEQMSRKGLGMIASAVPEGQISGYLPGDIIRGLPKLAAETMAEAAPPFVSRGSILTTGALAALKAGAPMIKAAGGAVGKLAEGWSGLGYKTPGILGQAYADPSLIAGPGKEAAGPLYEAAKDASAIRPEIGEALDHPSVIQSSYDALKAGNLTPDEALVARQSLDATQKSMPRGAFIKLRNAFDAIAKQKFSSADAAYARGRLSDELRQAWPVNKLGGPSVAKSLIAGVAGVAPLIAASPAVQGGVASGLGMAVRSISPAAGQVGPAGSSIVDSIRRLYQEMQNRNATP